MNLSTRERAVYPLIAAAGAGVALTSPSTRDFTRVVVERPDTVAAHVGSLATWLEFLVAQHPDNALALAGATVALGMLVCNEIALRHAPSWSEPAPATDGGETTATAANGEQTEARE